MTLLESNALLAQELERIKAAADDLSERAMAVAFEKDKLQEENQSLRARVTAFESLVTDLLRVDIALPYGLREQAEAAMKATP